MLNPVVQGIFSAAFVASILRVATPILLPSLGALISDRAGVINIGIEGIMLSAAFTGVIFSAYAQKWFGIETGQMIGPWLGMAMGLLVAVLMALLLGFFHLRMKANLVLTGLAVNILGSAGTVAIMYELTGDRGNTSTLASLTMPFIQLPEQIQQIPLVGHFIFNVFDNQSIMTWVAVIAVFVVSFILYRTPFGIHLRATGENPAAAASVGIPVQRMQYSALILSGILAGLGGIHMSMGYLQLFQRDMTSGRGFIALATPLLGGNTPSGTMIASLVFGAFDALSVRIGTLQIPSHLPQMVPYLATIMSLVIYALQTRQRQTLRALRAAQGEQVNMNYWNALGRVSVLHVVLGMLAVIGILISISLFAAPRGFGGEETAFPAGLIVGLASAILIGANLPFIRQVQAIRERTTISGLVAIATLAVYAILFLLLFLPSFALALLGGVLVSVAVWALMGGVTLIRAKA